MAAWLRRAISDRRTRWEGLCRHCGLCCYEKDIRVGSAVANYRRPCIHLNTVTHECTVYEKRFTVCPLCRRMTILHALFVHWLPDSCGYVQHYRYRGRARRRGTARAPSQARVENAARSGNVAMSDNAARSGRGG